MAGGTGAGLVQSGAAGLLRQLTNVQEAVPQSASGRLRRRAFVDGGDPQGFATAIPLPDFALLEPADSPFPRLPGNIDYRGV